MIEVEFYFFGDLGKLCRRPEKVVFRHQIPRPTSTKDVLESLGIPHTEVDLILAQGGAVGFDYLLYKPIRLEVHPTPAAFETVPFLESRLQPRPLTRTHFACDQHLGKLARLLRILGFDTLYRQDWGEAELARSATDKDRAVLTCNRSLLKRKQVISGRLIRSRQVDTQATEVVRRFGLARQPNLFGRCALCNHPLEAVSKEQVWDQIPNQTRHWRDEYSRCPHCHHLYWEGTHVPRLLSRIETIFERANTGE